MLKDNKIKNSSWSASREFVRHINHAATTIGASVEWFSDFWIAKISKNDKTIFIYGFNFPLNSATSASVANDKTATYELLEKAGIGAVEHALVWFEDENSWQASLGNALSRVPLPIVIKPNDGTGGQDVFKAETMQKASEVFKNMASRYKGIAISPLVSIKNEYRVLVLDGEVVLIYEKVIPTQNADSPTLPEQEWRHNLQHGAKPIILDNPRLAAHLKHTAVDTMNALGLRFASVDIIKVDERLLVLETNAGVMTEVFSAENAQNQALAQNIYNQALQRCFE